MIGTLGKFALIAFDTAMAVGNWGPPMTVTSTASTLSSAILRSVVAIKSRSMLPATMLAEYWPSSAPARLMTASGKRALRGDVMVGLTRGTWRLALMITSAP